MEDYKIITLFDMLSLQVNAENETLARDVIAEAGRVYFANFFTSYKRGVPLNADSFVVYRKNSMRIESDKSALIGLVMERISEKMDAMDKEHYLLSTIKDANSPKIKK